MTDLSIFDLTNRKAIVTGAGKGLGKAVAIALAKAGADVVVCARTLSDVERTAAEIKEFGVKGIPVKCDVRVVEDVENLFKQTLEKLGGVDVLVNNAGGSFQASFLDISLGGWDAIIKENLNSVFLCCKEAGKIMTKAKKGSIISMSSLAGLQGSLANSPCYGAAKAGIINLTKTLSLLWGPYNVRVNAVAPGLIETEGAKAIKRTPEERAKRVSNVPMGRSGTPEEVASCCLFLASDAASYVTGTTLVVTGGL
ncbi:SDR family NAD(P)-dependent oxidoreductase [Chloroflexota bacterium]